MEKYISFVLINLITDFSIIMMINYFCKLYNRKREIIISLFLFIVLSVFSCFYNIDYYQVILLKILVSFIVTLLLTDSFNFSKIIYLYFMYLVLMFSIYGFLKFFITFIKIAIFEKFSIKIGFFSDFIVIFALFLYIFSLILFFGNMLNKQNIHNFLYKVSFYLFEKHIEITGLLDSGNSLYDTKTGKAVMIVSLKSIKNYLDEEVYRKLLEGDYTGLNIINKLDCITVVENKITIPIII